MNLNEKYLQNSTIAICSLYCAERCNWKLSSHNYAMTRHQLLRIKLASSTSNLMNDCFYSGGLIGKRQARATGLPIDLLLSGFCVCTWNISGWGSSRHLNIIFDSVMHGKWPHYLHTLTQDDVLKSPQQLSHLLHNL